MDIKPVELTVLQLLDTHFYLIPAFQREYSWVASNVEDFWCDIFETESQDYFLGAFVVYPTGGQYKPLAVVDGQQRLTTITLCLAAIRTVLKAMGEDDIAKGIQARIARENISNKLEYILQTETSYPYLQEYIQKDGPPALSVRPGPEEAALEESYKYFLSQVDVAAKAARATSQDAADSVCELERLRDRLLATKLIMIQLPNEEEACTIFETLNTRGKNLRVSDLVKNHIYRLIGNKNVGVDLAKEKWATVVGEVGAGDMDRFVHHAWMSKNAYVGRPQLYRAIRTSVKTAEAAHAFVDNLAAEARDYRCLSVAEGMPDKALIPLVSYLQALQMFRVEQPMPLMIAILRLFREKKLTQKQVVSVLDALEKFHFEFTALTAQRTGGGTARMYVASAQELMAATDKNGRQRVLMKFMKKLSERRPKKPQCIAAFVSLSYESRSKNIMRYALQKIDMHYRRVSKTPIDYAKMTIEHLAPQRPPTGQPGQPVKNVHQIGNLLLLSGPLNDEFGNQTFAMKKKLLKKYKVPVDSELLISKSWGAKEVEQRGRRLAELAYDKIFALD